VRDAAATWLPRGALSFSGDTTGVTAISSTDGTSACAPSSTPPRASATRSRSRSRARRRKRPRLSREPPPWAVAPRGPVAGTDYRAACHGSQVAPRVLAAGAHASRRGLRGYTRTHAAHRRALLHRAADAQSAARPSHRAGWDSSPEGAPTGSPNMRWGASINVRTEPLAPWAPPSAALPWPSHRSVVVFWSFLYLALCRLATPKSPRLAGKSLEGPSERSKEIEILLLRHANGALRPRTGFLNPTATASPFRTVDPSAQWRPVAHPWRGHWRTKKSSIAGQTREMRH
jgi:hypothetical protein